MNLFLLRHASAGTRRQNPSLDKKRPLDKEGREQCLLMAAYLNAQKIQFDLIVSSPLKRALQTASLVGTETGHDAAIQIAEALLPSGTVPAMMHLAAQLAVYDNVLLVGHNPSLPQFLGALIGAAGHSNIRLRKAGLARVDFPGRPAQLLSLSEPRALRQFYASVAKSSRRKTSRK